MYTDCCTQIVMFTERYKCGATLLCIALKDADMKLVRLSLGS